MNERERRTIQNAQVSEDFTAKGLTFSLESTFETPVNKEA